MNKEYNADFILINAIEPIENEFPYEKRYGVRYLPRSQSQIFSQREDYNNYTTAKGCFYQSIYNQQSHIFNNESNSMTQSSKGRKRFYDQGSFRSQILFE